MSNQAVARDILAVFSSAAAQSAVQSTNIPVEIPILKNELAISPENQK